MLAAILFLLMIFASCSNTAGQVYASEIIIVVPHTTPTPDNNENREVTKSNGQELFPVAVTESAEAQSQSDMSFQVQNDLKIYQEKILVLALRLTL